MLLSDAEMRGSVLRSNAVTGGRKTRTLRGKMRLVRGFDMIGSSFGEIELALRGEYSTL